MRSPLFITFLWRITVFVFLFACSGALAAPALKRQVLSNRAYRSYQISDGVGGTAEVEARDIISGMSPFPPVALRLFIACTWLRGGGNKSIC